MNEKNFLNNGEYICTYCLNKNEDRLCNDYYQCCDEMNKLKNAYSDYLEKQVEQLQREIKQRDEVIDEAIEYLLTATIVDTSNFHQRNTLLKILQKYKGDNK